VPSVSCARVENQVDEMATIRSSGLPQRNARNGISYPLNVLQD
jgi:hypothetical protein